MNKIRISAALLASQLCFATAALHAQQAPPSARQVILATTTSLQETGLLDSLVPRFRAATGFDLRAVAVGSGQALNMGARGDADAVFAHSPAAEEAFMAAGHGVRRLIVATNYFTIVGPPDDPAHVKDAASAPEALKRIHDAGAVFVSRGDSSGTNARELQLWRQAGGLQRWPGYLETGQGMSATLLVAEERKGYTLTDLATYRNLRSHLTMVPLRDRDRALMNIYHVIELNPAGHPRMNVAGGRAFVDFMVSPAVQDYLADFGRAQFGEPLFVPARGVEP